MSSVYTHNLLIICPAGLIAQCNQLSGVMGLGLIDAEYFTESNYRDEENNEYCVRNTAVTNNIVSRLSSVELTRPLHDPDEQLDMVLAQSALDRVVVYTGLETPNTDHILCVLDIDPHVVLKTLNLSRIE